jgi:hypothetical protein
MSKLTSCLLLVAIFQTGCNSTVTDFVSGVSKPLDNLPGSPTPTPGTTLGGNFFMRVSQGHVRSTAGGQSAEMTVGPAIRNVQAGTDMSANIRLNSNRVKVQ